MLALDPPALIVLPGPISTNNLYFNVPGRGRVITKDYAAWKRRTADMLNAQNPLPRFKCAVEITFYVGEIGVGGMDTDNVLKSFTDALKKAGIIHDDSRKWVRRTGAVWVPGMAGCVARIETAKADLVADKLRGMIRTGLRGLLS